MRKYTLSHNATLEYDNQQLTFTQGRSAVVYVKTYFAIFFCSMMIIGVFITGRYSYLSMPAIGLIVGVAYCSIYQCVVIHKGNKTILTSTLLFNKFILRKKQWQFPTLHIQLKVILPGQKYEETYLLCNEKKICSLNTLENLYDLHHQLGFEIIKE